jgi:hypothetical protein
MATPYAAAMLPNLNLSPLQCRLARTALNWKLDDLSKYSGIHRFERGDTTRDYLEVKLTLRRVFERAKVQISEGDFKYPRQWDYE